MRANGRPDPSAEHAPTAAGRKGGAARPMRTACSQWLDCSLQHLLDQLKFCTKHFCSVETVQLTENS